MTLDHSTEIVLERTRAWIDQIVIGLNLCPFARADRAAGGTQLSITWAHNEETLLQALVDALLAMQGNDSIITTLLIHPSTMADFLDFNDFVFNAQTLVEQLGFAGIFQLASFHPDYQFAGTDADDAANFTNRSPYPMIHILRENAVAMAIDAYPNIEQVPERNIEKLRAMGLGELKTRLQTCGGR